MKKLQEQLQALTGTLPQGVAATRSVTVLEGAALRTVSGGASSVRGAGGGSSTTVVVAVSRRR